MAMPGDAQILCKPLLPNMVPSILVSSTQGTEPQDMALRDQNNNLWHLKIEKSGDHWYFTDGWIKFVKDNKLKDGDVLFYQLSSQGLLDFKIDTPDTKDDRNEPIENRVIAWVDQKIEVKEEHEEVVECTDKNPPKERDDHPQEENDEDVDDIDYKPPTKRRRYDHPQKENVLDDEDVDDTDNNPPKTNTAILERRIDEDVYDIDLNYPQVQDDYPQIEKVVDDEVADNIHNSPSPKQLANPQKEKVVDGGASRRVRGRRRKKQDYYGTELFNSGEVAQPSNPYFVVQARETRVNEMYIPTDLVRCYNLEFPTVIRLVDLQGREFLSKRTSWRDGRVIYRGGWRALCKVNLAVKDDKLICEFIREEGKELHLLVTFFKPQNRQPKG